MAQSNKEALPNAFVAKSMVQLDREIGDTRGFATDPDSDHRDGLASGAFQPIYPPVVQWREVLSGSNKVLKKKAAVAVARRLLIDIWKMRTGRTTAQALGLILNPPPRAEESAR